VSLIDTGETTMTGGRLKRVMSHLDANEFCMTMAMACRMWIFPRRSSFIEAMAAWRP